MQLIFLLFMVCCSKKIFEKEYTQEQLNIVYNFEESHGYIIQLDILEFPTNKNCFPVLEIQDEEGNSSFSDYESYAQKQIQQRVWLTAREKSANQTIRIYSIIKSIYAPSVEKCEMSFIVSIFENVSIKQMQVDFASQKSCNFPTYGQNCEKALNQFDVDLVIEVTVKKQSWFQAYYKLDNLNYQLKLTNPNKLMGISLVLGSVGHQPSFFENYILIKEKQTKYINLSDFFEDTDIYILVGLYNENNQSDQQMIIEMNQIKVSEFPIWATLCIVAIVMIGILIVVYIYYSYKKKYREITYVKPVIEKAVLDTYMPALKMNKDYTKLECSICLIQFEMSDKYRITPCHHLFHDQCLQDWTKKNGNCPLCRQGFKEEEIKIFCEKLNSNTNDSRVEIKQATTTTHFMKLSNTDFTYQQNNRSVNSPQHQLCCQSESGRKTSVLVIQDEVIE